MKDGTVSFWNINSILLVSHQSTSLTGQPYSTKLGYCPVTLPLWNPVNVQLGDVGYLSKPSGTFVTLFNAFKPHKTSGGLTGGLPSLAGYGNVSKGIRRQDKRNVAQKGLDAVSGFLTFTSRSNDVPISFVVCSSLSAFVD